MRISSGEGVAATLAPGQPLASRATATAVGVAVVGVAVVGVAVVGVAVAAGTSAVVAPLLL